MDLLDLTLLGPVNDLLALRGVPTLGLAHLAGAQFALLAAEHAVAALVPSRRRRRRRGGGGVFGFLALLCCLVPLAIVAGVGYLLWKRSQDKGRGPGGGVGNYGVPPAPGAPPAPEPPPAPGSGPDGRPGPPPPPKYPS